MEIWSFNTFLVAVVVMVSTGSLSFEATELEFFPEPLSFFSKPSGFKTWESFFELLC